MYADYSTGNLRLFPASCLSSDSRNCILLLALVFFSDLIGIVVGCYFAFFICITIIYGNSIDLSWRFTGLSMRRERLHMSPQARA